MLEKRNIIIFDGICNLCCSWIQFLIRFDKKEIFSFSSLQSKGTEDLLNSLGRNLNSLDTIIYIKNNQCFIESEAALEILKDLGGIWKTSQILKLIPSSLRNRIYKYIAIKRYAFFGKRNTCMVPSRKIEKRFIS